VRPGSFVGPDTVLATASRCKIPMSMREVNSNEAPPAPDAKAVRECFVLSTTRSHDQDPRFCLIVLSEVALRALSPAVNEPGTAIAAVEAARAGEQGRGFAVVAGEVRNLAQRSAAAAKEIKGLITDSVERVEAGSSLVHQAGATMQEVVTSIRRVTDIMGEINSASSEQSRGVSQIGEAVNQMDQATQQNAALVEESAAAAQSLQQQAQALVNAVAVFKLSQGSASAAPVPSKRVTQI
jgi:uncharacterized membrane protein